MREWLGAWVTSLKLEIGMAIVVALIVRPLLRKGSKMALEGKEVEGKIGSGGAYNVDVNAQGICRAELNYSEGGLKGGAFVEIDLIEQLEKLCAKTDNKIDDSMVAMIKGALGR